MDRDINLPPDSQNELRNDDTNIEMMASLKKDIYELEKGSQQTLPDFDIQETPQDEIKISESLKLKGKTGQPVQYQKEAEQQFGILPSSIKSTITMTATTMQEHPKISLAMLIVIIIAFCYCIFLFSRSLYEKHKERTLILPTQRNLKLPYSMEYLRNQIQIKIQESGISYLVMYDSTAKESAACFSMSSGSYHEKFIDDVSEGVAHLLEHSIFLKMKSRERNLLSTWNAWTGDESTQYMFATSNKNFLNSFQIYWRLLSNFTKTDKIYNETNAVDSEFKMDLQNEDWIKELLQSYVSDNKEHPAKRFSIGSEKTLKHMGIDEEVFVFYQNFYSTQSSSIVAIISSDKEEEVSPNGMTSLTPLVSKEVSNSELERISNNMVNTLQMDRQSLKDTANQAINYNLPYSNLPGVLFLTSKKSPLVNFKFQISNNFKSQFEVSENIAIIGYFLEYILIEKLQYQWKYANELSVSFDTIKLISYLEIGIEQTELGRKFIGSIVSVVLGAIQEVKRKYAMKGNYFDELKKLMDMAFYLTPKPSDNFDFTDKIADNIRKFGIQNAVSGWGVIDNWSKEIQENIFDHLSLENMLLTISEDLTEDESARDGDGELKKPKDWDLYELFSSLIGKPLSSGSDDVYESQEYQDQYHAEYKAFYHFQPINDKKLLKEIVNVSNELNYDSYKKNDFILSSTFMKKVQLRKLKNDNNKIEYLEGTNSKSKNVLFKFNENFALPKIYVYISFKVDASAFYVF